LLNNYSNVVEITANGPNDINSDAVKAWLDGNAERNYMLAGDEWLGSQSNWTNSTYAAGTFHYDVLGVMADYNDISYVATGDQNLTSIVMPVQGSDLGGPLYDKFVALASDTMFYDPYNELYNGAVRVSNWLDGFDVVEGTLVDMKGLARADGAEYNIGAHRTLAAGNKIVFFSYDPLSLNSAPYFWYGFDESAPQVAALRWFGVNVVTGLEDKESGVPQKFDLSQNYPNPFNPSTKISFSLPEKSSVKIKVFDILGREISTIVNRELNAGSYEVNFDGSDLSSGLYIYQISAGNFTASKKMMLMK